MAPRVGVPREGQFKPGQSGNPNARQPGYIDSVTASDIEQRIRALEEEAAQPSDDGEVLGGEPTEGDAT